MKSSKTKNILIIAILVCATHSAMGSDQSTPLLVMTGPNLQCTIYNDKVVTVKTVNGALVPETQSVDIDSSVSGEIAAAQTGQDLPRRMHFPGEDFVQYGISADSIVNQNGQGAIGKLLREDINEKTVSCSSTPEAKDLISLLDKYCSQ